jgi:transposase
VSMAAPACYRPGSRGRPVYRIPVHRRRTGARRSLADEHDAALIAAAHARLQAPIILIRDRCAVRRSAAMRRFCDPRSDRLSVVQPPAYACRLNATEGGWARVERGLGNLFAGSVDGLTAGAERLLERIRYRPELVEGFRVQTGLALDPQPP